MRLLSGSLLFAALCTLSACGPSSAVTGGSTSDAGSESQSGNDAGSMTMNPPGTNKNDGGVPVIPNTCPEDAKLVYVIDEANHLSSFAPATLKFTDLGRLNCPAALGATPFSMAVDRSPTAWVLYNNGQLFKVALPGLTCTAATTGLKRFSPLFGMGFVSNAAGSSEETLFIAAGDTLQGTSELSALNTTGLTIEKRGAEKMSGNPELTGTGDAKLWGFFPTGPTNAEARVAQIDKSTGKDLKTFPASLLNGEGAAWAFAFWGGDFWIFLRRQNEKATKVYRMKADGTLSTAIPDTGNSIVGAGVSTCAPIQIG